MQYLYTLGIHCYRLAIWLSSPFIPKAAKWWEGRKGLFEELAVFRKEHSGNLCWIHCASLGEFEQGRPIIEGLRRQHPELIIVLTFFSPSGYEIRKDYPLVNWVGYLPADTPSRAKRFIDTLQPQLIIFVKYEFWFNHLKLLFRRQIPVLLIAALFRPNQFFFRWYGTYFQQFLPRYKKIFLQNRSSYDLLFQKGFTNIQLAGDTRIDRVLTIASTQKEFPLVRQFISDNKVIIVGSSWLPDEELLAQLIPKLPQDWKWIFAPHQIKESSLLALEKLVAIRPTIRYSQASAATIQNAAILIIDNIGMLSSLYQYGHIAYIGGGFGKGIHNTLEPIAFGLPVIFGPRYTKFEEAVSLVAQGGGFSIQSPGELLAVLEKLQDDQFYQTSSQKALQYVQQNQGATQLIMKQIELME